MNNIKTILIALIVSTFFSFFFIIFFVLLVSNSSGDSSILVANYFKIPFEDDTLYTVTSEYGKRYDPLNNSKEEFHKGIDLATSEGTNVLASADGYVVATGYDEGGFGNYVYIEHQFEGTTFYSIYGHMLDDSIVVSDGQKVKQGDKIGCVGSTGASTGAHLHFAITINKLSFEEKHLVDPSYVINGLN